MKNAIRKFICVGCGISVEKSCIGKVKFCSPTCYHKHGKTGRKKNGLYKDCVVCNKSFYTPLCRINHSLACSVICSNKYQGRNKVTIICKVCNIVFVRSPIFYAQKYCSINCRNESEDFKAHTIKMGADQNKRKEPNNLELLGYTILTSCGVDFIRQYVIGGKFTVDAFIPSKNIVIQFDGDYWHGKKNVYPNPDHRQIKRMALDISQDAYMRKMGIKVVRFWESDFKNIAAVTKIINLF